MRICHGSSHEHSALINHKCINNSRAFLNEIKIDKLIMKSTSIKNESGLTKTACFDFNCDLYVSAL